MNKEDKIFTSVYFPIIFSTIDIVEHPRDETKNVLKIRITDMNHSSDAWIYFNKSKAIDFINTISAEISKLDE